MSGKNSNILNKSKFNLPQTYLTRLEEVVCFAKKVFKKNLKSIILGGSGGKDNVIPLWSDLDLYLIIEVYNIKEITKFMEVDKDNNNIHIGVTIYTIDEVEKNLIDEKTKIMIYEKEKLGMNPTLFGKNYFLKQNYVDIQKNDLNNLPNILHICRRNCIEIIQGSTILSKKHIKKFIVLLKCILNINGIFSYGYFKVISDFYNLCGTKNLFNKNIFSFHLIQNLENSKDLNKLKEEFIYINTFVFENITLLTAVTNSTSNDKIVSCMGIVVTKNNKKYYVALLKDTNNLWVLPKGQLEYGETFIDTAIREVHEESGINLDYSDYIDKIGEYGFFTDIENVYKIIKVYLFEIKKIQNIKPEIKENFLEGKWMSFEEAINIISYVEQKNALIKAQSIISNKNSRV